MSDHDVFAELLNENLAGKTMQPGDILNGQVVRIDTNYVTVFVGLKSEGLIPINEFKNDRGDLEVEVGDTVEVALDLVENGFGETQVSREKAKRAKAWEVLSHAFENNEIINGTINSKVKGGFTVDIVDQAIRAFLPGSLIDVRPVRDIAIFEGQVLDFKVIKLDQKRNNVVVSRRAVIESETIAEREELLANLQEGQEVKGIVKNLTDYGAFVDLGGIDGLLHITDMAWRRVKHPSEVVNVGDEINVKVLKFDRERSRVSLGLKQLGEDPWSTIARRYPVNTKLRGRVTNITDYGCFVEIEPGVEGLVHVSEMDWTNKNIHPSKVVNLGQEVDVLVLEIDQDRRRISLGVKQCIENPWEAFARSFRKGDRVTGKIKSITDFGIFVGLDGGIDGLVHLSDIAWNQSGEEIVGQYKKGDEIETLVLAIDSERERVSLGIKQLDRDPITAYLEDHDKAAIVAAEVIEVESKLIKVKLADHVEGHIKAIEISREQVNDAREHFKVGDELQARIMGIDRKTRIINLSIKAKETQEEAEQLQQYQKSSASDAAASTGTLGDLLRGKIKNNGNDNS